MASVIAEYVARIAALERKVRQLTMELDLAKKNSADARRDQQREALRDQRPRTWSIRRGCKAMNLPRSTYYYRSAAKTEGLSDVELT